MHNHYASGLNGGGALLTVKADDDEAQGIVVLLRENGARDIENDNVDTDTDYKDISAGYPGTDERPGGCYRYRCIWLCKHRHTCR